MPTHPGLQAPFDEAPAVQKARAVAKKLAASDLPILITGEVGTGRRSLAAALAELRSNSGVTLARVPVLAPFAVGWPLASPGDHVGNAMIFYALP